MKVKRRYQLSKEYQVCESEVEIEVADNSDLTEIYAELDMQLIPTTTDGLRKALGQVEAMHKMKQENKSMKERMDKVKSLID